MTARDTDEPHDGRLEPALRVGTLAHIVAWARQRDYLTDQQRVRFHQGYPIVLRRAVAQAHD